MLNENPLPSILVVEDESTQTIVLKRFLKDQNFTLSFATNGQEALDFIDKYQPDLVLCDWMMPGMSGIDVCREIKSNSNLASTIFILLTGKSSVDDQIFGLEAGADDFLNKPIEKSHLLARVHAGLRQKHLYNQLQVANKALKETQSQLIQAKKMSSLSRIVAGVAHEINNPTNFIYGNIQYLQGYFQDLLNLVGLFQQKYPDASPDIDKFITAIDLDYVSQDIPKILKSIETGIERISKIVQSLKNFSGLDESDVKLVSLNDCIETTLSLMRQQLEEKNINVTCEYGDVPEIYCHFRNINQALMHVIANAIDAIDEKSRILPDLQGEIFLKTSLTQKQMIQVSIIDNGPGVAPDVFENIFEPFFTTKPIGQGVGLGLSVAYRIIQRHQGLISCNSFPDAGTEFVIILPSHLSKKSVE